MDQFLGKLTSILDCDQETCADVYHGRVDGYLIKNTKQVSKSSQKSYTGFQRLWPQVLLLAIKRSPGDHTEGAFG